MQRFFLGAAAFSLLLLGAGCKTAQPASIPSLKDDKQVTVENTSVSNHLPVPAYFTARYSFPFGKITLTKNDANVSALWDAPETGQWLGYGTIEEDQSLHMSFFRRDREDATPSLVARWTSSTTLDGTFVDDTNTTHTVQLVQEVGGIQLEVIHVKKDKKNPTGDSCSYETSYPRILPQSSISESIRTVVNQRIMELASTAYYNTGEDSTSTRSLSIEERGQEYIDTCIQDVDGTRASYEESKLDNPADYESWAESKIQWYQSTNFYITLNQSDLLSIQFGSDEYTGGAHGNHGLWAATFDLKTGKELGMADMIKQDQWKAFFKLEANDILEQDDEYELLFDTSREVFMALVNDTKPITKDEITMFRDMKNFYLTPASFVLFYNEYEIAPYSAGQPSSELFYEDVKNMIKADSPVQRLIK